MKRRAFICMLPTLGVMHHAQARPYEPRDFSQFLSQICREAYAQGLNPQLVNAALKDVREPDQQVLQRIFHQPEFSLSWSSYRGRYLTASRFANGRVQYQRWRDDFRASTSIYGVSPRIIASIWGIESDYGKFYGRHSVVRTLATLSFAKYRTIFFRKELLCALRILSERRAPVDPLLGSYAGAMGQPQFMPSNFLRYGVDADGDGLVDIWHQNADVFASIGNFLASMGWQKGLPWGEEVTLNRAVPRALVGRQTTRSRAEWLALGVQSKWPETRAQQDSPASLLQPDGVGTQAFLVYHNFKVLRRYNPSDFYALGVGILSDAFV